jgi:hypothetical protein
LCDPPTWTTTEVGRNVQSKNLFGLILPFFNPFS